MQSKVIISIVGLGCLALVSGGVLYQRHVEGVREAQARSKASMTTPYRVSGNGTGRSADTDTDPGDTPEWARHLNQAVGCLGKSKDFVVTLLGAPRSTYGGPGSAYYGNPLEYIYSLQDHVDDSTGFLTEHTGLEFSTAGTVVRVASHFTEPGSSFGHSVTLPSALEAWTDIAATPKPDALYYESRDIRLDHPELLRQNQDDSERNGIVMFFTIEGHDRAGHAVLLRCGSDCYPALPQQHFNTQTNQNETTGYAPNQNFHWTRARVFEIDVQPTWKLPDTDPNMQKNPVTTTAMRISL